MYVWQIANQKGVTFEQVVSAIITDEQYSVEDAENFWNSKWVDVQDALMFYGPINKLFA